MKVLVTGASGRLGSSVFQELLKRGHEPVLFSRARSPADYGDPSIEIGLIPPLWIPTVKASGPSANRCATSD